MMLKNFLIALAMSASLTSFANDKADIQAQYNRWSKAYMANDVETLLDILAPDYLLINIKKEETTREKYAAYLKLRAKSVVDITKYKTDIRRLKRTDNIAEVTSIETMETPREDPETHAKQTVLHRHEYLDEWVLGDSVWRLRKTTTIKESTLVRTI